MIDMAFTGQPEEDVVGWIANAKLMIQLYELDNKTAIKAVISALDDVALDWAGQALLNNPEMAIEELFNGLRSRFISRLLITKIAQRFSTYEIPESIEEFFAVVKDGGYLHEVGYLSLDAVTDRIIARSPPELRAVLWLTAERITNMFEFSREVEKIAPFAYDDYSSKNVNGEHITYSTDQKRPTTSNNMNRKGNYCLVHGRCAHCSEECKDILALRDKYRKKRSERGP